MNKIKLSHEQQKASEHLLGPALTLAVPGSGKTTLLMVRTMALITTQGILPQNILTVTFSKASAEDMKRRFREIYPKYTGLLPYFMTIHSFCFSILKQYQKKNRIHLKLIDSSGLSKYVLIKDIVATISGELISDEALETLINEIGYVKNRMLEKSEFEAHTTHKFFTEIYNRYEAYKKQHQLIDFDDMLTMTYNILKASPNALNFLKKKYTYIQVDEAQDTSDIQFELLKLLGGKASNIFMVADDDQSIYAFRGANPQNLLSFKRHFGASKTYYLSNNYRSTQAICTASNAFIKQNKARYEKSMVAKNNLSVQTPVYLKEFDELDSRNIYLINALKTIATENNNVAILFRNNVSSVGLAYLLYKEDMEFFIKDKSINFFNHFSVQDMMHFMQLALANNDVDIFEKIAHRTGAYIPKSSIDYVKAYNRGRNVFDTLLECKELSKSSKQQISTYKNILNHIANTPPLTGLRLIEKDLGYLQRIEKISSKYDSSSDSIKRVINQLKIIARACPSITSFMSEIEVFKKVLLSGTTHYNSKIHFTTFHSSKGLEYDTVYIIDPLEKDSKQQTELLKEEERRLFYVAMTRAKKTLNILYHKFEEGAYLKEISYYQFLKELDKSILSFEKHTVDMPEYNNTDIMVGAVVKHVKFGKGVVAELNGDTITIEFNDKIRSLSYALCKKKGLM